MFKKTNRLGKQSEVKKAFARGRSFFDPNFTLKYRKTQIPPRFAIVVSTKVSKKATARNRLKRILRETLRLNLSHVSFGDYVLIARPSTARMNPKQMRDGLLKFLTQKGLLKS